MSHFELSDGEIRAVAMSCSVSCALTCAMGCAKSCTAKGWAMSCPAEGCTARNRTAKSGALSLRERVELRL